MDIQYHIFCWLQPLNQDFLPGKWQYAAPAMAGILQARLATVFTDYL